MVKKKTHTAINIAGEVNQTINKNNRRFIKLTTTACYIELGPDILPDVHLGDMIEIDGSIEIRSIDPCFNRKRELTLPEKLSKKDPEE